MVGAATNQPEIAPSSPRNDTTSVDRRLKIMEERHSNLRSNLKVTEQNMLQKNKTFFGEIKALNVEMTEIKKELDEIKDKMMSLIKELDSFAKKDSYDILKKYIDLWNPVNFVTKNDVENIVLEIIERIRKE